MLKKNYSYFLIVLMFGVVITLSFITSYTSPTFSAVNMSLCSGYTSPTFDSVNFTLGEDDDCDTCTCAGLNNDWEIDMSDLCVISDNCDLGTGTLSFTGTGNATCNALIETTEMGGPTTNSFLYIDSSCNILID